MYDWVRLTVLICWAIFIVRILQFQNHIDMTCHHLGIRNQLLQDFTDGLCRFTSCYLQIPWLFVLQVI